MQTTQLALPSQCAVCRGWSRARLCTGCLQGHVRPRARCTVCALAVPDGVAVCGQCLRAPPPFARCVVAVDYGFPWQRLIADFKFRGALDLAPTLASLLCQAVQGQAGAMPSLLLPIPLSAPRLAERGMNQAWELARRVGRTLAIEASHDVLRRLIDTGHLADLPRQQRAQHIRGAFGLAPGQGRSLQGRCVALIDDVLTTGATAAEAARVLLAAGAAEVQVWAVARTPAPED